MYVRGYLCSHARANTESPWRCRILRCNRPHQADPEEIYLSSSDANNHNNNLSAVIREELSESVQESQQLKDMKTLPSRDHLLDFLTEMLRTSSNSNLNITGVKTGDLSPLLHALFMVCLCLYVPSISPYLTSCPLVRTQNALSFSVYLFATWCLLQALRRFSIWSVEMHLSMFLTFMSMVVIDLEAFRLLDMCMCVVILRRKCDTVVSRSQRTHVKMF